MSKADELLRAMGGIIAESASHRGTPAAMPTAPPGSTLTPDRLAGVARSKAALDIPAAKIEPDPAQPREEFDDEALGRLADSIRARGILQPIRVRWDEGRGRYVIIAGERRWRASCMAGLATLPCVVDDRPATPGELLAMQMVENCLREDLKPIEQAKAFRALMDLNGWSGNHLAKELGIAQSGVVQALALLELPAPVQSAVDHGAMPASTAYALATLDDPAAQEELAARVVAEGMSRAATVEAVRQATGKPSGARGQASGAKGRGGKPKKITSRVLRAATGTRVTIENKRGLDASSIQIALREVLDQVEAELATGDQAAA
jgi:ParB family transcriptional regulator, chromosome partitioning protein